MTSAHTEFRDQFPMLANVTHLANCSQGARSLQLDQAMLAMLDSITTGGAPWGLWMDEVAEAKRLFAQYINASVDEIAVLPNATIGAYQAISTLDLTARPGIVSTELDFHSVGQVWAAQQERRGAQVTYLDEQDGISTADAYDAAIDEETSLVSVPLVSYKNGVRLAVREVIAAAHAQGARTFVDAYQGAGVVPIDVQELRCDYLVTGTLKYMLGLPGLAFLYVRGGVADQVPPVLTGWFGRANPFDFDPKLTDFATGASRFETGTPAVPAIYAANAGLRLLLDVDAQQAWSHVQDLVGYTADRLREVGATLYSRHEPEVAGPQVTLEVSDAEDLGAFLHERNIFTSPRGIGLRLSFHYYNNRADADRAVDAIAEYLRQ